MLCLVFCADSGRYAIDARKVLEVAPLVELTALPGSGPELAGIMNYRGEPVPVVDMTRVLCARPSLPLLSTRIVMARCVLGNGSEKVLGLLIEQATETMALNPDDIRPAGVAIEAAPYLDGVNTSDDGMIVLVEPGQVLPDSLRRALFGGEDWLA